MDYKLLIGGSLVEGAAGTIEVVNPATGQAFAAAPRADIEQLDAAVAAARSAFPGWSALSFAARGEALGRLAAALEAQAEAFAQLLTREQGKPAAEARYEVAATVATLRAFAAMSIEPELLSDTAAERIVLQRYPLGVVAAITPWNVPLLLLANKLGPALMAGNCVVAKPAPTTPLTTLRLGALAAETLPGGVLNIIVDDNDLGPAMTRHAGIDKISFTGSTATGRKVMEAGSAGLKRLTLELGGNDAAIILDDADIDEVAPRVFRAAMINAGQICLAAKRIFVPSSLYEAFSRRLGELAREAIVGNGADEGTQIGPVQNRQQYERLKAYLADARANGTIIAGGDAPAGAGFFIAPTVVRDIGDDARLVREEQFGPILPILSYATLDEVIARANDSEYGLGATIWTSDPHRGIAVASRITSGTIWVNKHLDLRPGIPFGGAGQSGMGSDSLEDYTQVRVVNAAL